MLKKTQWNVDITRLAHDEWVDFEAWHNKGGKQPASGDGDENILIDRKEGEQHEHTASGPGSVHHDNHRAPWGSTCKWSKHGLLRVRGASPGSMPSPPQGHELRLRGKPGTRSTRFVPSQGGKPSLRLRQPSRAATVMLVASALMLSILPILVPAASAETRYSQSIVSASDQDIVLTFWNDATPNSYSLTVTEWKDLNEDGDIGDANEAEDFIFDQPITDDCIDVDVKNHFSCSMSAGANSLQQLIWRNASTRHKVGNYSIQVDVNDALGNPTLGAAVWGVRIVDPSALSSDINNARENLRAQEALESQNMTRRLNEHDRNASLNSVAVFDDFQDVVWHFDVHNSPEFTTGLAVWHFTLQRREDNNLDGAMETTSLIAVTDQTTTACAIPSMSPHFGCDVSFSTGQATFLWRNSSTEHKPGNYTMRFHMHNGSSEAALATMEAFLSVRITQAGAYAENLKTHQDNSTNQFQSTTNNLTAHDSNETSRFSNHDTNTSRGQEFFYFITESNDAVFSWDRPGPVAPDRFALTLFRLRDLNNDGDFGDVDERESLVSATSLTDCGIPAFNSHFSCSVSFNNIRRADLTWRKNSTHHVTGNYSFEWVWQTGATSLTTDYWSVRLTESFGNTSVAQTQVITNPPDAANNELMRFFLLVLGVAVIGLMATRQETMFPLMAFGLGFAAVLVQLALITQVGPLFTSSAAQQLAMFLPVGPGLYGAANAVKTFNNRRRR